MDKLVRDTLIAAALIYGTVYFAPPMILIVLPAVGLIHVIMAFRNGGRSIAAFMLAVGAWPVLIWFETGRYSWQTLIVPAILGLFAVLQLSGVFWSIRRATTATDDHLEKITASHIADLERNRMRPEN